MRHFDLEDDGVYNFSREFFPAPAVGDVIFRADTTRVAFLFSGGVNQHLDLKSEASPSLGISTGQNSFALFTYNEYGPIVQQEFIVTDPLGPPIVTYAVQRIGTKPKKEKTVKIEVSFPENIRMDINYALQRIFNHRGPAPGQRDNQFGGIVRAVGIKGGPDYLGAFSR